MQIRQGNIQRLINLITEETFIKILFRLINANSVINQLKFITVNFQRFKI